jgi:hypothetical protein
MENGKHCIEYFSILWIDGDYFGGVSVYNGGKWLWTIYTEVRRLNSDDALSDAKREAEEVAKGTDLPVVQREI